MNRNIRFNDSNNFIYDFKELDMICFVDDVSYQTHSVLDFIDIVAYSSGSPVSESETIPKTLKLILPFPLVLLMPGC